MTTAQAEPLARCLRHVTAAHLAADLSDRELLEHYAGRRDEAAFTALVRRHGPLVLGACRRVLGDAHAAEDVFQATFLLLARKAGSLRRPDALGPWLHGVATRIALKARVREARRRAVEGQAAALAATAAGPEDPVWRDLRPLLDEAVGGLPDKLRVPFVLHYLEGRTVTAVARQLGCPRGTVATHLARARQRLRARLTRRGVTLSAAALGVALSRQLAVAGLAPALPGVLVKTAAGFAAGQAAAGTVPAGVVALAQGGLPTMSLKKQIVLAVLLLGLGAAGGGTVLLAQGTGAKGQPVRQAARMPPAVENDLALFREGSKRFLSEDYPGADRSFSRLVEEHPDSALVHQALELAIISKHVSTGDRDDDGRKVSEARRIIDAVLAGARAAEARQGRAGDGPKARPTEERMPNWADKLFQGGTAYDFGSVPHGAQVSYRFPMTNIYAVPLQITDVRTSCGCVTAKASTRLLQPRETGYIEVTVDARRFTGPKSAYVRVTVGPEYASTAELRVSATSRAEDQNAKGAKEALGPNLPSEGSRAGGRPEFTQDLSRPITTPTDTYKEKHLEKLLQRPVNLNLKDAPLNQVVEDLRAWHGLNVVLDRPALEKDGISPRVPITVRLDEVPLRSALKVLLHSVHLAYIIRDGALVVTTPTGARGRLVMATYQVADLVTDNAKMDALLRMIQRTIAPETWSSVGGPGTLDYYPLARALIVNQTADVQEQLAGLLESLRRLEGVEEK